MPESGDNERPHRAAVWSRDRVWAEYLSRMRSGDESALARLYDESAGFLYGIALKMTANAADAEEVVSDVYLQVWRGSLSWNAERGSIFVWMSMMCRSRCIDKIRSRAAHARLEVALTQAAASTSDDETVASIERHALRRAMEKLAQPERELLTLAFFSGLTHTELSAKLNAPLGTVKARLRRAVERLRCEIAEMPA